VRWWSQADWEDYFRTADGMWPGLAPLSREEWDTAHAQGYTYCAALVEGRAVAIAAVWRRSEDEWEVAAVGTAPAFRRRGYGKAVVSFVADHILRRGRAATIGFRTSNVAMRRTAESVGFGPRRAPGEPRSGAGARNDPP
jgi:predicted GNAT family acetyltransferase